MFAKPLGEHLGRNALILDEQDPHRTYCNAAVQVSRAKVPGIFLPPAFAHQEHGIVVAERHAFALRLTERGQRGATGLAPLAGQQLCRPIERQRLGAAEHGPLPVRQIRAVGHPIARGRRLRVARTAESLQPHRAAGIELGRKSVDRHRARLALRDDVQAAVRRDQQRLCIVRAVWIGRVEYPIDLRGSSALSGLRHAIDGDRLARRVVVADVRDIDARSRRARPNRYRLPILHRPPRTIAGGRSPCPWHRARRARLCPNRCATRSVPG